MKKAILLILFVFFVLSTLLPQETLSGQSKSTQLILDQDYKIENVYFEQVENNIIVYYDLVSGNIRAKFSVSIEGSDNNGKTWDVDILSTSGDIGEDQIAGTNKKIIWNVLEDYKEKSGPIKFKILVNSNALMSVLFDERDGENYNVVLIDNLLWMQENLAYNPNSEKLNNKSLGPECGGYYRWETALSICPDGWHLPSDSEWKLLEKEIGLPPEDLSETGERGEYPGYNKHSFGNKLKDEPYNFTYAYCGYIDIRGNQKVQDVVAIFWTSTEDFNGNAFFRSLSNFTNGITRLTTNQNSKLNVRCVKKF